MLVATTGSSFCGMVDCSVGKRGSLPGSTNAVSTHEEAMFKDMHLENGTNGQAGVHWPRRERWFLDHTPDDSVVVDLGAGAMHLNTSLAKHRSRITYLPVDFTDRGVEAMSVCQFNRWQ